MRRPILLVIAALFAALFSAGCVPFDAYDSPGMSGIVRDRVSNATVSGARITVTSLEKPNLKSTAATDTQGHFHLEEIKHQVWLPPLPYDFFYPDATVTVSAAGYKILETTYYRLHQATDYNPSLTIYLDPQ